MPKFSLGYADGVVVLDMREGADLDEQIAKVEAAHGITITSADPLGDVPSDRAFRDAWRKAGPNIVEHPPECRRILQEEIETARRVKMRELLEREALGENVVADKLQVRNINPAAEVAGKDPDQCRTHWPPGLGERRRGRVLDR